jgi:hypothetical protein
VFQLYLLADGQLGEAWPAPAVPGTVEYLAWSPDGTRILLAVAGLGAEMADARGSGTAGSGESGLPSWYPEVEAGTSEDAWRGLWLYTPASGELARVSPDGLNVWEAAWSGPGHVLAITSEQEPRWIRRTARSGSRCPPARRTVDSSPSSAAAGRSASPRALP